MQKPGQVLGGTGFPDRCSLGVAYRPSDVEVVLVIVVDGDRDGDGSELVRGNSQYLA